MPKTILIVDDDADARVIFETALEEHGYRAVIATQGAEGIHLARRERPDLILLDIRMPVMDGWEAVQSLRTFRSTRNIQICGMSAYRVDDELVPIREFDFDHFLSKPIDPKDLIQHVEGLIGPPRPGLVAE